MRRNFPRRDFLKAAPLAVAGALNINARAAEPAPGTIREPARDVQVTTVAAAQPVDYRRPDFAPLRDSGYGVGFHWKPEIVARGGAAKAFPEAVRDFDVKAFAQRVDEMGAGHVLFTLAHGHRQLCAPNPEVDRLLKGRTVERDLILDLARELAKRNVKLIVYYNIGGDAEWQRATGWADKDAARFFSNWIRIFSWMGEHNRDHAAAWWVDSTQTYGSIGKPPWKEMAAAAHAGFAGRLVCFNSGLESLAHTTLYQDFWAGEIVRLNWNPRGESANGLPWYTFTSWHADSRRRMVGEWFLTPEHAAQDWPPPAPEAVAGHYRRFRKAGGTATFNVLCYQDGSVYDTDFEAMRQVKRLLRG